MYPYLSIVITTRNRNQLLINEINCLNLQNYRDFEIIIVDDNSKDEILISDLKIKKDIKFKIIKNDKKLSMAKSRNIGILNTSKLSKYILILDDDNEFDENFLSNLISKINEHDFDIGQPRAYYSNKKDVMFFGFKYHLPSLIVKNIGRDKKKYPNYFEIDSVGNCFLIKREVINKIGIFDEKYVIDFSETEFCFRAKIAKFKISSINTNIYHQTMPENNSHILKDRILKRPETYYYTFRNKFFIAKDFFNIYYKILFIFLFQFITLFAYLAYCIKVKSFRLFKSYFLGFIFGNLYFFFGKIISYEKIKKLFNNINWLSP